MERIEIRPAVARDDLERAYDIWGTVFPEDRSFFQERLDHDADFELDTTWLALVNGRVAAATQIFPYRMRWGMAELKVGGIGNVATLPDFRRRGLAQQLLRRQCSYMTTRGYDLSLLMTGINPFYEQLGWRTVKDPEWVAEAAGLRESRPAGSSRVRTYTDDDLNQVSALYDSFDHDAIAPRIRSKEYWRGQMSWKAVRPEHFLVAEEAGRIVAFLRYKTTADNEMHLLDCGYAACGEAAVLDLLHHALAAQEQVTVLRALMPSGHVLDEHLANNGARMEDATYKMWRTFDLNATLRKMAPELQRRIRQEHGHRLPDSLLLVVNGQESVLSLKHQTVDVTPAGESVRYDAALELSAEDWLILLLKGCGALEQQGREGIPPYLQALFPDRPYVFWPADHF